MQVSSLISWFFFKINLDQMNLKKEKLTKVCFENYVLLIDIYVTVKR